MKEIPQYAVALGAVQKYLKLFRALLDKGPFMHEDYFLKLRATPSPLLASFSCYRPSPLLGREIIFVQLLSSFNSLQTTLRACGGGAMQFRG